MSTAQELPEHFEDGAVCAVLRNEDTSKFRRYALTCGLAMKLRSALLRVIRRSVLKSAEKKLLSTEDVTLYKLVEAFTTELEFLHTHWPSTKIFHEVVLEVAIKSINLSPALQRELSMHPIGKPYYVPVSNGQDYSAVEFNGMRYALDPVTSQRVSIEFDRGFLRRVRQYHEETRRPEGTFDSPIKEPSISAGHTNAEETDVSALLLTLANLPKEVCPQCKGRRQVYCGDCNGRRMPLGEQHLPTRVVLPFDVLLVVHWQETLHKCTGVHVGALCQEGCFESTSWRKEMVPAVYARKEMAPGNNSNAGSSNNDSSGGSGGSLDQPPPPPLREEWKNFVETLDPRRDVLLFPCEDAVRAEDFPWNGGGCGGSLESPTLSHSASGTGSCTSDAGGIAAQPAGPAGEGDQALQEQKQMHKQQQPPRWRLVVLEASWNYGKGMALQLKQHREAAGLAPIPCVQLTDITGQYWKFQTMGHSAVSTIEAVAYTARAAGVPQEQVDSMLLLFQLQKYRVLERIERGGKVPRAVEVSGAGLGCWKDLTDCLEDL